MTDQATLALAVPALRARATNPRDAFVKVVPGDMFALLDRLEAAEREAEEHRMEADDAASVIATSAERRRDLERENADLRAEVDRQQHFWEGVRDARVQAAESALAASRAEVERTRDGLREASAELWAASQMLSAICATESTWDRQNAKNRAANASNVARALAEKGDGK